MNELRQFSLIPKYADAFAIFVDAHEDRCQPPAKIPQERLRQRKAQARPILRLEHLVGQTPDEHRVEKGDFKLSAGEEKFSDRQVVIAVLAGLNRLKKWAGGNPVRINRVVFVKLQVQSGIKDRLFNPGLFRRPQWLQAIDFNARIVFQAHKDRFFQCHLSGLAVRGPQEFEAVGLRKRRIGRPLIGEQAERFRSLAKIFLMRTRLSGVTRG